MGAQTEPSSVSPSREETLASLPAATSYRAPPKLTILRALPTAIEAVLRPIWQNGIARARPVKIFRLSNVYVVSEGLVFDRNGALLDVSKTYHSKDEIIVAFKSILSHINDENIMSYDKGILAQSRGATNYGHFILEMLPRAWLARTHLELSDWPAVIHAASDPDLLSVTKQALNRAGFSDQMILTKNHQPVLFKELILVDGLTSHGEYLSPHVMQCLDDLSFGIKDGDTEKVYVPRAPARSRDFEDESAIAEALANLGYQRCATAYMDFDKQVSIFKGARAVVGVTGAALTNTVFCNPGTTVTVFSPSAAAEVLFWMIAEARRLHYHEIRCEEVGPQLGNLPWDRAIRLAPENMSRLMQV